MCFRLLRLFNVIYYCRWVRVKRPHVEELCVIILLRQLEIRFLKFHKKLLDVKIIFLI